MLCHLHHLSFHSLLVCRTGANECNLILPKLKYNSFAKRIQYLQGYVVYAVFQQLLPEPVSGSRFVIVVSYNQENSVSFRLQGKLQKRQLMIYFLLPIFSPQQILIESLPQKGNTL
ncbi:hypothetical protein D3C73_1318840 [compost metagenome]